MATITSPELQSRLATESDLAIIDVRTGAEFEGSHIPGSLNIPMDHLQKHAAEMASITTPTVVVCASGVRSQDAYKTLSKAGMSNLVALEGGLNAWQSAGGDVHVGESKTWAIDRQVRFTAGSLVLAGVAASAVVPGAVLVAGGIGAGLVFSAVSNTCAMGTMLGKLPFNRTDDVDVDGALSKLGAAV